MNEAPLEARRALRLPPETLQQQPVASDVRQLLVNLAAILDGWKQTAPQDWTDWDQQQRDGITRYILAPPKPLEHVCGLQGFGRGGSEALDDTCPACDANAQNSARDSKETGVSHMTSDETRRVLGAEASIPVASIAEGEALFRQRHQSSTGKIVMSESNTSDEHPRWTVSPDGKHINDDQFHWDGVLRVTGDFAEDSERIRYAQAIADVLNKAEIPRE
jgi:hypothetical protein